MLNLGLKIVKKPPTAASLDKQVMFGITVGLTRTAKEGQTAVQGALRGTFTLRGSWFQQSNFFGIKVKPATKTAMTAEIRTKADWLLKQLKGGDYFPFRNFLAIPTANVRRNKRQIITKGQRPKNLQRAVVIKTKSGLSILFQRKGRGRKSGLVAMYILVPKIRVKSEDAFFDPIEKVVGRRLNSNVIEEIMKALATAK